MAVSDIDPALIVNEHTSWQQYLWQLPQSNLYRWEANTTYMYSIRAIPVEGQGLPPLPPIPTPLPPFPAGQQAFLDGRYVQTVNGYKIDSFGNVTVPIIDQTARDKANAAVPQSAAGQGQVYIKNGSNQITGTSYSATATPNTMVQRDASSQVNVATTPTANGHATSKSYVDGQIALQVSASAAGNSQLYGKSSSGVVQGYPVNIQASAGSIAQRDSAGQVNVSATPTAATHAVSKGYADGLVAPLLAGSVNTTGSIDISATPSTFTPGISIAQVGTGWPTQYGTVVTFFVNINRAYQIVTAKETGQVWTRTATGGASWSPIVESLTDQQISSGQALIKNSSGAIQGLGFDDAATASTLARRTSGGQLIASDPTAATHLATKSYVDGVGNAQVSVTAANANQVYFRNSSGTPAGLAFGNAVTNGALVQRDSSGQVNVPTAPTSTTHAASKQYVDAAVATASQPGHTHVSTDITDTSSIGRQLMTAVDAGTARGVIGAAPRATTITGTGSLTGGGDLTANRAIDLTDAAKALLNGAYQKPSTNIPDSDLASTFVKTVNSIKPDANGNVVVSGGGGGSGTVSSVNGKGPDAGGAVTLVPSDVGAVDASATSGNGQAFIRNSSGVVTGLGYTSTTTASTLVQRTGSGDVAVPATPGSTNSATSKQYVDGVGAAQVSSSAAAASQVHAKDSSGNETGVAYGTAATGNALAQRDSSGQIAVPTPTATSHATSKNYVDSNFARVGRAIATGTGLQGGGTLAADRTLSLDATSQSGVAGGNKFNAQVFVMDASTTTDALNTFLAQGGYRSVSGTATLTKPLIIPGGTVLDAYGATFNGITTDNIIANAASVPRVTATGSSTAGSNLLMATTGIFSASDVGRQVQLLGAGPNARSTAPGSWYGTITAVNSATSVTVDVPANISTSGKTLYLYGSRDADIVVMGGIWKPGNKNAISQTQQSHGWRIRRADRIAVIDVTIQGPGVRNVGGQYAISFGDTNHVITRNIKFVDTNSDGIHFQGPARDILIDGVQGTNTGDDLVAFTGVDGQSQDNSLLGDTEGDISDVEVHNIYGYDVWTHLKITGGTGPGGVLRNITRFNASGIYGNAVNGAPVNIVDYAGLTSFSGRIAEISAVGSTTSQAQLSSTASNVKMLNVEGVYWPATNTAPATGMVVLGGNIVKASVKNCQYENTAGATTDVAPAVYVTASSIGYLDVDGTFANNPATPSFGAVVIASALVATRVSVTNHHSEATAGNAIFFTVANWNIKAINFDRLWRKSGSWIDGTASSNTTVEITATNCSGGTAWILLRQTASIMIAGCIQSGATGAGIRMIGANAYAIISVSGSSRNTTLVSKDGSQNLRIIECTCIGVDASLITVVNDGDLMRYQNTLFIRSSGAWKAL